MDLGIDLSWPLAYTHYHHVGLWLWDPRRRMYQLKALSDVQFNIVARSDHAIQERGDAGIHRPHNDPEYKGRWAQDP